MVQLAQHNPGVHAEFMKGNCVVQKSRRQFSLMAKDQSHEQSNKILQTNGGAAGLHEIHEPLMLMPQRTSPIHSEYRVLPAPDVLQRKGCQAVLLPSRKMIYPFRTSLASCAPPRDDMLNKNYGDGSWMASNSSTIRAHSGPASKNSISGSWICSCSAIRLEDLI